MGETRIFSMPDSGAAATNNSIAAMLPALLQNRGIDTAALMGMMSNGNGGLLRQQRRLSGHHRPYRNCRHLRQRQLRFRG